MSDRTVHATRANGSEVVRYDRAGKWFLEWAVTARRKPLTVAEAAELAAAGDAAWYPNRPGGQAFDARVRKLRGAS